MHSERPKKKTEKESTHTYYMYCNTWVLEVFIMFIFTSCYGYGGTDAVGGGATKETVASSYSEQPAEKG